MQAFETLFTQYFQRIYRYALALTKNQQEAEDLTQQTFYKALKNIHSFRGQSDPATWLCSIAKNEYLNILRNRREQVADPASPVFDRPLHSPENSLMKKELLMLIHHHLHSLEEPYREVFTLRVFGELKFAQIASLFQKTESWARVTFYRAKCQLQEKIRKEEPYE